ncbi:MAG: transglycosylase SLT domain-containing protein, partial [Deltaproteobacteria bacterium]|nr:transglycosylase SLT domain-containing protein [Deltaproteobacteria bacterium]
RSAEGLAPITQWVQLWEAQARLDAGQPEQARAVLALTDPKVWGASVVGGDARVTEADARLRTDDREGANEAYRAYLSEHPNGDRRFEVRTKLARLLQGSDDDKERREALKMFDQVRQGVPLSDYGEEATRAIAELERELGPLRKGAAAKKFTREQGVRRAEALLARHRYARAIKAVGALVSNKKLSPGQRCRLWYVKGSSIFKQRRRADARVAFDRADRECAKAGTDLETLRVKSRYQGARGWYAAGKYEKAGKAFEALATDHPKHSYADDALVLAGESWESAGKDAKAGKAYVRALDDHPGDKADEARRRLLVMRFAAGDHDDALEIIDKALSGRIADPVEQAKLHYFRGRALERLHREDDATAAWLSAVDSAPLSYPALQAMSRLRERGPEVFAQGVAHLRGAAGTPAPIADLEGDAALRRAGVLARLGLGTQARDELRHAKVKGWRAVAVLNQAGLYPAAQRELANMGRRWRRDPPGKDNRLRWEGAHPQPFAEIIAPAEPLHAVPPLLTYAIMQTESRFDPGVTSFAGARGLVQLMPATARGLAKAAEVSIDREGALFDPAINLDLGMRYLGKLTARYGVEGGAVALAIPSYNAGAGSVDRWLSERGAWELDLFIESIPYDETRGYTQSVLGRWMAYRWLYGEGEPEERLPYLPRKTPSKV